MNTYSYNKDNPFDVFEEDENGGETHNSFIMDVKHWYITESFSTLCN